MRTIICAVVLCGLAVSSASAAITVYEDDDPYFIQQALDNLGMGYTYRGGDDTSFVADLASGSYDMAIISQSNWWNLDDDWGAVNDFVAAGNKLIVFNFTMNLTSAEPIWASMGASWNASIGAAENPIVRWDPLHPVFTLLHQVPDLAVQTEYYTDNGDYVSALAGATAIGGGGGGAMEAMLIVRDDGRTILNTFLPGDYNGVDSDGDLYLDISELIENEILYVVPEPATMSLLGLGLAGLVARRKRK